MCVYISGLPAMFVLPWAAARAFLENNLCWTTKENPFIFLIIRGPTTVSILVSMQNLPPHYILYYDVIYKVDRMRRYNVTLPESSLFLSLNVKFVNNLKKSVKTHLYVPFHDLHNTLSCRHTLAAHLKFHHARSQVLFRPLWFCLVISQRARYNNSAKVIVQIS